MKFLPCFQTVLLTVGLAVSALDTQAQFLFQNVSGANSSIIGTNLTSGATFTLGNQAVLVTALGIYDDQADGFSRSYNVGLWGSGGLIASATLPGGIGSTLVDGFRYVPITPVVLNANTTFRIGTDLGYVGGSNFDALGLGGTATLDSAFSFINPRMRSDYFTGFVEPTLNFNQNLWAANLQYTAVPEPTVMSLLLGGLVIVGVRQRRAS
jgi:hypothetical protein